jgi:cold shock CspA family protein
MDEYRPFPAEDPAGAPAEPEERYDEAETSSLSDVDVEEPAPGQPERPAPNLDHPGGHLHGTVARLNRPRRFGFLRADDGVEVFFHASALEAGPNAFDTLRAGQEMEFDCHQDDQGRGLAATVVTIIGEPPPEPPRAPRAPRSERPARGPRATGGAAGGWHVAVLHDRYDAPASAQLERLLNERGIKPGSFTLGVLQRGEGTECWVAYHTGAADEPRR